jgi:hypothetical protein
MLVISIKLFPRHCPDNDLRVEPILRIYLHPYIQDMFIRVTLELKHSVRLHSVLERSDQSILDKGCIDKICKLIYFSLLSMLSWFYCFDLM